MSKENIKDDDLQKITGAGDEVSSSGGASKTAGDQGTVDPDAPANDPGDLGQES